MNSNPDNQQFIENRERKIVRNLKTVTVISYFQEVMMRKKSALLMESRYSTMIENAFYYSNPPEVQQVAKKVRPPMHEYIRKLLYKDLSKVTTEKVIYIL